MEDTCKSSTLRGGSIPLWEHTQVVTWQRHINMSLAPFTLPHNPHGSPWWGGVFDDVLCVQLCAGTVPSGVTMPWCDHCVEMLQSEGRLSRIGISQIKGLPELSNSLRRFQTAVSPAIFIRRPPNFGNRQSDILTSQPTRYHGGDDGVRRSQRQNTTLEIQNKNTSQRTETAFREGGCNVFAAFLPYFSPKTSLGRLVDCSLFFSFVSLVLPSQS